MSEIYIAEPSAGFSGLIVIIAFFMPGGKGERHTKLEVLLWYASVGI